jgi:hypothetical protein
MTLKTKLYWLGAADRRPWIILINGTLYNFKLYSYMYDHILQVTYFRFDFIY